MSDTQTLRIGIIGAGGIFRSRHLPNLAKIEGVRVVAVCNRSRASAERIAGEFKIPEIEVEWRALAARPDLDAVFIGTWPYMHREMSVAALVAGKHVFCQARMCMDLEEARQMVQAARAHRHLVNMICPPPTRMPFEDLIKGLIASGELGDITAVHLTAFSDASLKSDKLHWRENVAYSGRQIMGVGICAETLNAWVGDYTSLSAEFGQVIARKYDEESGREVQVQIPQVVAIQGKLACGAVCSELHVGVAAGELPDNPLTICGTRASLQYALMSGQITICRSGTSPEAVAIPAGHPTTVSQAWTVERDFVDAVRAAKAGQSWKVSPDFEEGLRYMAKMEAIHHSARSGQSVTLAEL